MSCWHLHQLLSQNTQYLDSWLSCRFTPKWTKYEIVGSWGGHVPVPHSWRPFWTFRMVKRISATPSSQFFYTELRTAKLTKYRDYGWKLTKELQCSIDFFSEQLNSSSQENVDAAYLEVLQKCPRGIWRRTYQILFKDSESTSPKYRLGCTSIVWLLFDRTSQEPCRCNRIQ